MTKENPTKFRVQEPETINHPRVVGQSPTVTLWLPSPTTEKVVVHDTRLRCSL